MNLDELKLPSPRDDFAAELMKYKAKQPYDAGHLIEYVAFTYTQYVAMRGQADPDDTATELSTALRLGLKPLMEFINLAERNETLFKAAYAAAKTEKRDLERSVSFWRSITVAVASLTVAWSVGRTILYLAPLDWPWQW